MGLSEGGGTDESWMKAEQTWMPKGGRITREWGSGIAQGRCWLRRRRGIDDRDESREDAPVSSRTRHFSGILHYPV